MTVARLERRPLRPVRAAAAAAPRARRPRGAEPRLALDAPAAPARPGPDGVVPVETLTALVRSYNPKSDSGLIAAAYEYGRRMHGGQIRRSGEPYFSHPVAVAMLLAEQKLDDATIVTALLHDTIEDTLSTYSEIALRFGDEVAQLVDGVTKLTNLELSSVENEQAENFRKLLMAMSKDLRVLLVKLADRLHNMRTIRHLAPEKQQRKARETMDIFAPLAGRMGMQWMREELEDIAFRILQPEARKSIIRRFVKLRRESGDVIAQITEDIRTVLSQAGVEAEVLGREKKPYAIWRKMEEKKEGFSRLSDIYGFRIVTRSVGDCYVALGAVHQRWRAVPGRFKDYISQPKSNGYRSIHTTVSGRDGKRVEVQIRTAEMHAVAETGVAAHWSYKNGERFENPFAVDPFHWLRSITERFERPGGRGLPRARQARDVPGPGVLLHPEGRGGEAAARRHADRLRLRDPHPDRRQLRRRQGRRPARAALDQAPQRPVGDDHPRRGPAAAAVVGGHGGHRPRQGRDPAQPARRAARHPGAARPRDRPRGARARRQEGDRQGARDRGEAARARGGRGRARPARRRRDDRQGPRRHALPRAPARRGAAEGRQARAGRHRPRHPARWRVRRPAATRSPASASSASPCAARA